MRVAFEELRDRYVLDLNIPVERIHARPWYDNDEHVMLDRLGQVFYERVRVAFLDAGEPRMTGAVLKVGVSSPLDLGLLHVEKIVSDALVDAGVLAGDRVGHVRRIEVYRRVHSERDLQDVEVVDRGGRTIRREFFAIASERRAPTPVGDYALAGIAADPAEYHRALDEIALSAGEAGQFALISDLIRQMGEHPDLARRFRLTIGVDTWARNVDLDNVGLFVLDLLTIHLARSGWTIPLDQLVGYVRVYHRHDQDAYHARLSLLKHPE